MTHPFREWESFSFGLEVELLSGLNDPKVSGLGFSGSPLETERDPDTRSQGKRKNRGGRGESTVYGPVERGTTALVETLRTTRL